MGLKDYLMPVRRRFRMYLTPSAANLVKRENLETLMRLLDAEYVDGQWHIPLPDDGSGNRSKKMSVDRFRGQVKDALRRVNELSKEIERYRSHERAAIEENRKLKQALRDFVHDDGEIVPKTVADILNLPRNQRRRRRRTEPATPLPPAAVIPPTSPSVEQTQVEQAKGKEANAGKPADQRQAEPPKAEAKQPGRAKKAKPEEAFRDALISICLAHGFAVTGADHYDPFTIEPISEFDDAEDAMYPIAKAKIPKPKRQGQQNKPKSEPLGRPKQQKSK